MGRRHVVLGSSGNNLLIVVMTKASLVNSTQKIKQAIQMVIAKIESAISSLFTSMKINTKRVLIW